MIRRYCDRPGCGAEITKETHTNVIYDLALNIKGYLLTKKVRVKLVMPDSSNQEVDLCDKCKKELFEWFNKGGK